MNRLSKRAVFAFGAPLALASVLSGSVAFAASLSGPDSAATVDSVQQQSPSPTTPADPTTPANPTTPSKPGAPNHDPANCPNMGGSGGNGSSDSGSSSTTNFGARMHRGGDRYY